MPRNMVSPTTGEVRAVPDAEVNRYLEERWLPESDAAGIERETRAQRAAETPASASFALGALSGGSGGLTDALARLVGGKEGALQVRETKEAHPTAAALGEVGGGLAASVVGVGPIGKAAQLGNRIARAGEGAGAVARIGRAALGAGIEGAAMGAGSGVSEFALSAEPLSVERAVSTLSSRALYGGLIGGAAGTVGKSLEIGLQKGAAAIRESAANASKAAEVSDDLARLDAKGLRLAKEAEVENLVAQQATKRAESVEALTAYSKAVDDANPWAAITEGEPSALLNTSRKSLRRTMNDPIGLAENPGQALKALRVEEQAFVRSLEAAEDLAAKTAAANAKMTKSLTESLATDAEQVVLSGKAARRYGNFADVKVGKNADVTLTRDKAQSFLDALNGGEVSSRGQAAMNRLPELIEQNRALQAQIKSSIIPKADLKSAKLEQIVSAQESLSTRGAEKSFAEKMAGGGVFSTVAGAVSALPIPGAGFVAPMLGAKAASFVGEKVFGRLGAAMSAGEARAATAVSKVFETAARGAKASPPLATRVLNSVAFAPPGATPKDLAPPPKEKLPDVFRRRADELREQVATGPTGAPMVRPHVRERIAKTFDGIGAIHPQLADRLETLAVRRLEFLAGKLPKRPDLGVMSLGPETWNPSDSEMRTFARYVAAAEDPDGILERVSTGQVSPEDGEVMRELYPEMLADVTRQVLERLPTLRATLPRDRRIALSVLTGVAVEPSLAPHILKVTQSQFSVEMQPPRAAPQFGSVKNHELTASERREQGS